MAYLFAQPARSAIGAPRTAITSPRRTCSPASYATRAYGISGARASPRRTCSPAPYAISRGGVAPTTTGSSFASTTAASITAPSIAASTLGGYGRSNVISSSGYSKTSTPATNGASTTVAFAAPRAAKVVGGGITAGGLGGNKVEGTAAIDVKMGATHSSAKQHPTFAASERVSECFSSVDSELFEVNGCADSELPIAAARSRQSIRRISQVKTALNLDNEIGLSSVFIHFMAHCDSEKCTFADTPEEVQQMQQLRGHGAVSRGMALQPGGYPELTKLMASAEPCSKVRLYAGDSNADVQAMDFWNVNECKVYTYSGLNAHGDPQDTRTACGILMLDQYAIQERVGDPSSPLTWWPYQAFYVIPKDVNFATCKAVGSSGKDARVMHPDKTRNICNGLDALAIVASEEDKDRLFVTGDCGYYSLATEAYVSVLLDMGWVKKDDACANAPCFRVRDSIDVYLCLGTPQMIASPDPAKNIVGKTDNCNIIYSTADLRGWYGGEILDKLNAMYPSMDKMKEIMRFNEGIPWGMMLAWHPEPEPATMLWKVVADQLQEYEDGNTSFILGMYIAWASKPVTDEGDQGNVRRQHWLGMPVNAKTILEDLVHDKTPFQEFMKPGIMEICRKSIKASILRKTWSGDPNELIYTDLTKAEVIAAFILLMGRTEDVSAAGDAWANTFAERTTQTIRLLCDFDEGEDGFPDQETTVTCGHRYCDWYCKLIMRLNKTVIRDAFDAGKVGHAIDARKVFLLDALFIPGFGEQVAEGLTVWCFTTFYCWLSRIYAGFAKLVQEDTNDTPVVFHQECTELFQFTDFLQQFGMPCIDNPNYLVLASMSTDKPLKFKRWSYDRVPAAMMYDSGMWYRCSPISLRTPDMLAEEYAKLKEFVYPDKSYTAENILWDSLEKGAVMFDDDELGIGHGEALYMKSTAIVDKYIGTPHKFQPGVLRNGSVQYG